MVILFRRGSGRHMQVGCPLQWVTSQTGCVPSPTVGSTCIPENCLCVLGPATHVARMGPSGPVRWPSSTKCCPLYPNDRKGVGLMGWGSGRKFIQLVFALRSRSGARLKTRARLRSGSLGTQTAFLRCSARLARGGLFFRFPKYRQNKH